MPTQSKYTWDLNRLQFRDTTSGRFVSPDKVFQQINRVISVSERRMMRLADQLRANEISVAQFKDAMRTQVKALHVATSIAANGGLSQMTPARWGKVGAHLKREYSFLNNFGAEIGTRSLPRTSALVRSRARAYTANARIEYWETVNARLQESGMLIEAARKMGSVITEHCAGCRSVSGEWKPLSSLPPIGTFECRWFCQCSIIFRITKVPKMSPDDTGSFMVAAQSATRDEPLLSTNLTRPQREFVERMRGAGMMQRQKVEGRFVYYAAEPQPTTIPLPTRIVSTNPPTQPAIARPIGTMTDKERTVFERISAARAPVPFSDLNSYEAHFARRLWQRGELVRTRRGVNFFYSRTIPL